MSEQETLTLTHGDLKFTAYAQGSGPVALMVHGFPDTLTSYRHQLPALADVGYRAVSVALRGYEPQSIPGNGDYFLTSIASDVIAWADELGGGQPVHLIGHDWGAIATYVATSMAPEKFHSATTIAIPETQRFLSFGTRSLRQMRNSWYIVFFQLGRLADWALERNDFAFVDMLWRHWSPGWDAPREEVERVKAAFRQPGVKLAALGYYRAFFKAADPRYQEAQRLLAEPYQVPTMTLLGEKDGCLNHEVSLNCMFETDFKGGLEVHSIKDAGHFMHQEKPDEINALLIDWLNKNNPQ